MPSIRLNKVARDLQVGVKSIVDYLSEKDSTKEYSVNSKISVDEFKSVVNEFGKELSKEERKALIDANVPSAAPAKTAKPEPNKEEPKKESEKPAQVGPVIKGKIELDSKGNVIMPKKESKTASEKASAGEAEKVAPKVSPKTAPEPKPEPKKELSKPEVKAEPKKEEPKPEVKAESKKEEPKPEVKAEPKKEEPKPEVKAEPKKEEPKPEVKTEPKKEEPKPVVKTEPRKVDPKTAEKDKPRKDPEPVAKPTAKKAEEGENEKEESNVFRLERTEDMGVTVVGKVDLSKIQSTTKRRKRKRISSGKVDVDQVKKQQSGKQTESKTQKGDNKQQPRGKRNERNDRAAAQQKQGRKARRKQQTEQKPEITQEDIQKQIRETMAAIQGGRRKASSQAARYRRDKREAHRKEMDLQEQEQMMDKTLQLTEYVTANDLAQMIDVPVNEIIMLCFNLGMMISINQRLEKDTIDLILSEYGYTAEYVEAQMLDMIETEEDAEEDLKPRAPIVTVMGHVDHGKTSLLDAIRNADVIDSEAGGITQHIGAYSVTLDEGKKITFLDTPGHEAFTAMRARGAKVTDIVIIVVAADDGVMPQTKEALSHASLADVPIIFAINKIDKPQSNPDRIKEELANLNYLVEDWGGKYQSQEISAKKGLGINELLEKVLLEAEIMELKANPDKKAVGSVLESTMERGLGYTTKVLIQEGTLHMGDFILAGENYGRVKALFNERGKNVESVGPSEPVKVLGLSGATQAGEVFNVLDTEAEVRDIATRRSQLKREQRERTQRLPSLQDLSRRIAEGNMQELNIIVKGDMDGSVEALSDSIVKLSTDEIRVNVIHKAVGQITESDVILASASDAIVIGFQVRPAQGARRLADEEGVEIRLYSIIYDALDEIKTAMEGMLSPEIKERVTANIEVRETFRVPRVGVIAGCYVRDGKVSRNDKVRVIRDGIVIHTGGLGSLKRFKDDVREVTAGYECGLNIDNYNDVQVGDLIEAYEEIKVKREL